MKREINYHEVFDAQQHFRVILDAMARPGNISQLWHPQLQPPADMPVAAAATAMALLNADVSFCVVDDSESLKSHYISLNTAANATDVSQADFIFMSGHTNTAVIAQAKTGTLPYPEEGATLIVWVEQLSATYIPQALAITLTGPGIENQQQVFIKGISLNLLNALHLQNTEFPLGVDAIFTDAQNLLLCIPRSSKMIIEHVN